MSAKPTARSIVSFNFPDGVAVGDGSGLGGKSRFVQVFEAGVDSDAIDFVSSGNSLVEQAASIARTITKSGRNCLILSGLNIKSS
jgi:hypothetical protein